MLLEKYNTTNVSKIYLILWSFFKNIENFDVLSKFRLDGNLIFNFWVFYTFKLWINDVTLLLL